MKITKESKRVNKIYWKPFRKLSSKRIL